MKTLIKNLAKSAITWGRRHSASKMSSAEHKNFAQLTSDEWNEVNQLWRVKMGDDFLKLYPKGFRVYKSVTGKFDAKYCPNDLFEPYILRALNLPVHVLGLEHKAMYDMVFPQLLKPKTLFKCINGVCYDANMNGLSMEQAYQEVMAYDAVCVKLTSFSACGKGVKRLESKGMTLEAFQQFFATYGDNYIVQEVVKQSPKMSRLSAKSLNTFRVSSLYINGKCSVCTILNRIGRGDSFVDNGLSGNYMVGVGLDGQYLPKAYDKSRNQYDKTDTGVLYADIKLDEILDLVRLVEESHIKCLPHCGFCGWDFALDEEGRWVLIEVNLYAPGVEFEQIAPHRPLFGERTQEVIDYVNSHQPSMLALTTSLGL